MKSPSQVGSTSNGPYIPRPKWAKRLPILQFSATTNSRVGNWMRGLRHHRHSLPPTISNPSGGLSLLISRILNTVSRTAVSLAFILPFASLPAGLAQAPAIQPDKYTWLEDIYGDKTARLGQSRERALRRSPRERPALRPSPGRTALKVLESPDAPPIPGLPRRRRLQHLARRRPRARHRPPHHPRRLPHPRNPTGTPSSTTTRSPKQTNKAGSARASLPLSRRRLCLVALSAGGEDADTLREFDLKTGKFVDGGFALPALQTETSPGSTKTPSSSAATGVPAP